MVYIYEDTDGQIKYTRGVRPSTEKVIELKRMISKPMRQGYESVLKADFAIGAVWYELVPIATEDESELDLLKKQLKENILNYDSSEEINHFIIEGKKVWLDKATRVGLKLRFEAELAAGELETTLWLDGKSFTIPLAGYVTAIDILNEIELYASKCYDNTQKHLSIVDSLYSKKDILNYNFTIGYPERLIFQ